MNPQPPKWLMRFFQWFCRQELCDAIEGDLLVVYQRKVQGHGRFKANLWYFFSVLTFIQPFALKKRRNNHRLNPIDMISNFLKVAFRNLKASRSYTVINVLGLAIGITGFVVMIAYVQHELSYDRFHKKSDRIVRIVYDYEARGTVTHVAKSAFPLKPMLLEEYPEVEKVVRFFENRQDAATLRYEDKHFTEAKVKFADPEVFEVFDFQLEAGNPATALKEQNSIVITARAAKKYFGEEDPMGKLMKFKEDDDLKVTGILAEVPQNSHIDFDMLMPVELQRQRWMRSGDNNGYDFEQDWRWSGAWLYVLLKTPESSVPFEARLYEKGKDYFGREDVVEYDYKAQALTDIHLHSQMSGEASVNGNIRQVYGFGIIAVLILVIACINFINLSTARSARRAKEVGLRKVMGAYRSHLIGQFIAESVLITLLAMLVAVFLIEALLPYFNQFMEVELHLSYLQHPELLVAYLVGAMGIGFLAGLYPAFYLSRFQPAKTLKGNVAAGGAGNVRLRKVLVTSQFVISNLLIIGILAVQAQLDYLKNKDLGFDKDQVIVLGHGNKLDEAYGLFSDKLKDIPQVVATNRGYVAGTRDWTQSFKVEGVALEEAKSIGIKHVGFDFLDMFDMELVLGRNFSRERWKDWKQSILLNEKAVKNFGWTNEEALGKIFSYVGGSDNRTRFECKVVGIVADAHLESLYQPIRPSVFRLGDWGEVSIKFLTGNPEDLREAIGQVEKVWYEVNPKWPFEYEFLDKTLAAQYQKEERLGQTIQFFTLLAIFIACLGLFGLAAFSVQQRTREIGVRKVLGASMLSILGLVSQGFLWLVGIAFLISVPVGYYFVEQWLQNFAYAVPLEPMLFLLSGLISLVIAALAVVGQSLRATTINPIRTLRHE